MGRRVAARCSVTLVASLASGNGGPDAHKGRHYISLSAAPLPWYISGWLQNLVKMVVPGI